jgi:PAS domain S-box-containing protein
MTSTATPPLPSSNLKEREGALATHGEGRKKHSRSAKISQTTHQGVHQEKIREALVAGACGVCEWDLKTGELQWSREHFEIFGYVPNAVKPTIGLFLGAIHPEDLSAVQSAFEEAKTHETNIEKEFRIITPSGEIRWVLAKGRYTYRDGMAVSLSGTATDITQRKNHDTQLQEVLERLRVSESLYRGIGESINYGIWVCDAEGNNTYASESFLKLLGVTQKECSEFGWKNALHPDEAEATIQAWKQCVKTGTFWEREHRFKGADGQWHPILARGVPIRDSQGAITCWAGINLDIKQLKSAEEQSRKTAEKLQIALHAGKIGIWDWNIIEDQLTWSPQLFEIHGLPPENFTGKVQQFHQLVHPDDKSRVTEAIETSLKNGTPYSIELRTIHPKKGLKWIMTNGRVIRDEHDNPVRMLGATLEITEQKLASEALRASEERFSKAFNFSPLPKSISRLEDDVILEVNESWLKLFGYQRCEVIGKTAGELNIYEKEDYNQLLRNQLKEQNQLKGVALQARTRNGEFRETEVHMVPTVINQQSCLLTILHDVTEERQARRELEATKDKLSRYTSELEQIIDTRTRSLVDKIEELEAFSYSVSHDLRAPLRALTGYADAMLEDCAPQLDSVGKEYLNRIFQSAIRLDRMTHDVLAYTRLARGDFELVPIDLSTLLAEVLNEYPHLRGDNIQIDIANPLGSALGHEPSLVQCISNLLGNAIKFVKPGINPKIRVRSTVQRDFLHLHFEDNGIGIPKSHQERIFGMFERFHPDASYEGTGIGLAIVRKAVKRMGGQVLVQSRENQGSTFTLVLKHSG